MQKPFLTPGKLYDNFSVEGIVCRLLRLVQHLHEAELSDPDVQAALKKRAAALLEQSRGTITGPLPKRRTSP